MAAATLALGHAVGETIAVTLLIGNGTTLGHPFSLLNPGGVLGSIIVLTFGESQQGSLYRSALMALAVILLVLTLIVNLGGRWIVRRNREFRLPSTPRQQSTLRHRRAGRQFAGPPGADSGLGPEHRQAAAHHGAGDPHPLRYRRRPGAHSPRGPRFLLRVQAGASMRSRWHFFTQTPTPPGIPGGGISNSIVGTLIICGLGSC